VLNLAVTNIGNVGKDVFVWHRVGKNLRLYPDKSFLPYFYQIDTQGIFHTILGQRVKKIVCKQPYEVKKQRNNESYEADVLYTKRFAIDRIGLYLKADLKYSFCDIEVLTKDLPNPKNPIQPISCISCSNSYTGEIKTFYIAENENYQFLDVKDSEIELLKEFVTWIKEQQFDLILGWNFLRFDYAYLRARYNRLFDKELAEELSSIGKIKYLRIAENEETMIPVDLAIVDYLDWYKKVFRGEVSYSLDDIALKEIKATIIKTDFSKLTSEIKEKNINDVRRMIDLEKQKHLIDYYDTLRRMSKADWQDLTWNSKIIDMMLLQEAKLKNIILPTKIYGRDEEEEDTFEGAYRRCETGLYKNLWKLDLGSAYPRAIIEFCLDVANIKTNEGIDINGTKFYQNSNTLLPTLARKLINQKDTLKQELKQLNPETEEYKDLHNKYDGVKAVVNSLFGVCGLKVFRLFDIRVASAITFLIRDLLHYVEEDLKKRGMKVVYIDTDSVFVEASQNPELLLNQLIKQWAKEKYNKDSISIAFECEGQYDKIFVVALCHYKGYLKKKSGIEIETKGLESKRKDSSVFMREFQDNLIEMILAEKSREDVEKHIDEAKEKIKTVSLLNIGFPGKLTDTEYKSIPISLRAYNYTQEMIPDFKKSIGDIFYWVYVDSFGEAERVSKALRMNKETGKKEEQTSTKTIDKDVLAFDANIYSHVKNINWNRMIEKTITNKVEHIFEARGWEIIKEVKVRKIKKSDVTLTKKERIENEKELNDVLNIKKEITHKEIAKQLEEELKQKMTSIEIKEEDLTISHSFTTKADITDRTVMIAEAFGLGIDDEKTFVIYQDAKLKVKTGDIVYITGDSGSGKSWLLKNIFAKMANSISIDELKIDDNEVVIEGVGKDLNDALMKLNIAGLGDAFLYLRKYSQLSDGQKYRYRIAKFIDQEDKNIWILDEFCATLDRVTAKVVAFNLQKIARKLHKTVIVATTHTDLLDEIRPTIYIQKGYESDVDITYYKEDEWKDKQLAFYNDVKVEVGTKEDYEKLKKFHYRQARLGALKKVYKCTYKNELVGVIVIAYPHLALKGRNIALNNKIAKMTKENCDFINQKIDYVARVIVLPKYRGIGLSYYFLKEYFKLTDATYVETVAVMANYNPFFEKAGMTRIDVDLDDKRETSVKVLEQFGFRVDLMSSTTYIRQTFNKLSEEDKAKVRDIVINIVNKYKGASHIVFAKINHNPSWKEDLKKNDELLFEYFKQLRRSNTIYLIKQLKEDK
jgi:DNA polymerase elongation subunit (family B)/ABC-type lipoprotein export system ATPase subunit